MMQNPGSKYYGLNTISQKNDYWRKIIAEEPMVLADAIASLNLETAKVIRLYYIEGKSMQDISLIIKKSISIVRHHHSRGIFLIYHIIDKRKSSSSLIR
jgi:DNA-directed RNA polymerase specialized sigma24 family protein